MTELSKAEELVMKCIWDSKEKLSLADITKEVNKNYDKAWKSQTVSTFLSRLVKKEYCEFQRGGRQFFYTPLVTKEDYRTFVLNSSIDFWANGNKEEFIKIIEDI